MITHPTIILIFGSLMGFLTQPIFHLCGIYTGEQAISYYGEVHQSKWNSLVHTIGMPFTYYGLLLCVPPLFCMNKRNTELLQLAIYLYFISYYISLDLYIGLAVAICYSPSQVYAMEFYQRSISRPVTIIYGFMVAATALTVQEVFGHWVGGDDPSRLEAIPNAIWHAGYYSIWHLFYG